jgi:membrane-bound inhibitor of C-type lysozyme
MLRSKLASSLLRIVASCSLTAKPQSRRLKRDQRSCGTEQLEVRQLLTGDFVSAERFGSNGTDTGYTTTIDASGNVYTAGTFSGTVAFGTGAGMTTLVSVSGSRDIFVTKTSSAGNFVWAKKWEDRATTKPTA